MRISIILYIGTAVGLVFGGYGAANYDWRLLLLLNPPVAVVSIRLPLRHFLRVPPRADPRVTGINKICIGLLAVALISLQVLPSRGETDDWFGSLRQPASYVPGLHAADTDDAYVTADMVAAVCRRSRLTSQHFM